MSASPSTLTRGTTTTVTVTGRDFRQPVFARVSGGRVSVDSLTWISETKLEASVTVQPNALPRPRDVLVANVGTGPGPSSGAGGSCAGCLTVE